ncbi:anhydro-N-acetylmuramic acid kinase [Hyunsoonleella flava]|uniref:Anhydro-N-acetylmuramic acid kinase n=1 Tax=Hyunsoonleella flava TaxID=2527939 RepID=A0A4Q9FBC3_9FLAO|nr:anhydro-N-acetylmuramic acid kinase [Hyunsoonleella flava]TBN01298.1 anhydro-N-acetylmuramic acid kinase [Hyunsoonleella flava]
MAKNEYHVIGIMSGTSLDGIDLVYTQFHFQHKWTFKILLSKTISYDNFWIEKLKSLVELSPDDLKKVDQEYTRFLAKTINTFIENNDIIHLDAICSHGHTALHKPEKNLTYQIGNKPIISKLLELKVVCDFRIQDVKLGGQGAPLVPIGDKLLFSDYDFCLNFGGFANISLDFNGERIAYDICPVNIVLNYYTMQLGLDYDDNGSIASSGNIDQDLLLKLNELDFYHKPYPKSLGLEWVKAYIFPLINSFQLEIKDILCTFCEHIAIQVSKETEKKKGGSVLLTGGGAYNAYLLSRLKHHCNSRIIVPEKEVVEFKEALIFAFLGILKLRNEVNCLKSVTGASKNHSTGEIYQP